MYKILSLSGGGVKGFLSLQILNYLEKQSGKKISDMFDLVVGTSSGAIIGAYLDDHSAVDLSYIFEYNINQMFTQNPFSFYGLLSSLYSTHCKTFCIDNLLGYKFRFNNYDYAAVSYDIKNNKVIIFNTLEEENTNTYHLKKDFSISHACNASSAAPIYWDPCVNKDSVLIDGAVCANNPVSVGIKLALNKNVKLEDLHIVTIGTGLNTKKYNLIQGRNPFNWALPLFNTLLNSQSNITNMLYENESLHYYNLDVPLIYASDNIDCITKQNFENLILDSKELIKQKELELHTILHTFI